ncbi:hypothetical protein BVC93_32170 (plasmid) [Mycobacterium sp. MS1601]|jgi:hypothetical protein|uniref:hypothetical protein n=1 Tax=Mycobacterium sp. MS1601 TaxID=1936029 RepID=UPI0009794D9A|nr:hypothetical protein [Mycobacterium sp. MS1601]AQA07148.1 hypothetical protein BVC93_32170 [Mycobacterium sp. MS1601]
MTAVPGLPQPVTVLPCHTNPDQWFNPVARTTSLKECLACTYRQGCAQRALHLQPTDGMWAGVWISNDFDDVAPLLTAIATDTPCKRVGADDTEALRVTAVVGTASPPPPATTAAAHVLRARRPPTSPEAPRSLVLARCSGHCEVMAPGCALAAHELASRLPGREINDPALLYAVCRPCAEVVQSLDTPIARRLGYTLEPADAAASIPFLWRQAHRVLLDSGGALTSADRHRHLDSRAR